MLKRKSFTWFGNGIQIAQVGDEDLRIPAKCDDGAGSWILKTMLKKVLCPVWQFAGVELSFGFLCFLVFTKYIILHIL